MREKSVPNYVEVALPPIARAHIGVAEPEGAAGHGVPTQAGEHQSPGTPKNAPGLARRRRRCAPTQSSTAF